MGRVGLLVATGNASAAALRRRCGPKIGRAEVVVMSTDRRELERLAPDGGLLLAPMVEPESQDGRAPVVERGAESTPLDRLSRMP